MVIIGELFSLTLNLKTPQPALALSPWLYGDANKAFYSNKNPNADWTNEYITNMINETGMGVRCLPGEPVQGFVFSPINIAPLFDCATRRVSVIELTCGLRTVP